MTTIKDIEGITILHTTAEACVDALLVDVIDLSNVSSQRLTSLIDALENEYINRLARTCYVQQSEGENDY